MYLNRSFPGSYPLNKSTYLLPERNFLSPDIMKDTFKYKNIFAGLDNQGAEKNYCMWHEILKLCL